MLAVQPVDASSWYDAPAMSTGTASSTDSAGSTRRHMHAPQCCQYGIVEAQTGMQSYTRAAANLMIPQGHADGTVN